VHFEEREVGQYRIYAGAIEAQGGYVAAAVVKQVKGAEGSPEVFRDEAMSGGHRWEKPEQALQYAIARAKEAILPQLESVPC
jgi:hypothetical protein